jgi:unsaturated rhamnogalacturonyl hydrolase
MTNRQPHAVAPTQPWSVRMTESVMQRNVPYRWHYEYALVHRAIEQVWLKTGDARYFDYIKREVDPLIGPDGSIKTYSVQEYNLDQINPGRTLLMLYRVTGDEKYKKAAYLLHERERLLA